MRRDSPLPMTVALTLYGSDAVVPVHVVDDEVPDEAVLGTAGHSLGVLLFLMSRSPLNDGPSEDFAEFTVAGEAHIFPVRVQYLALPVADEVSRTGSFD